jgi:SPP1 gp7 family putative phage head morphogenesis protein
VRDLIQAEIKRRRERRQRIPRGTLQPSTKRIEQTLARKLAAIVAADLDSVIAQVTQRYPGIVAGSRTAAVERAATTDSAEDAIRGLFNFVRLAIKGSDGKLRDLIQASASTVNARNKRWVGEQVQTLLGINPMQSEPWLQEQLALSVNQSVQLIQSAKGKAVDDIEALVMRSVAAGESTEGLAKQMENIKGINVNRTKLIARDQTGKLLGNLTRVRFQELGFGKYEWSTSGDERVRPMHKRLDGKVFDWDNPPITNEKGERNNPGQDINCRCTALFVL